MNVVQLRELLLETERDMGQGDWPEKQKAGVYALYSIIATRRGISKSDEIKSRDLVGDMKKVTCHRFFKNIAYMCFGEPAPNTKAESYVSPQESDDAAESA